MEIGAPTQKIELRSYQIKSIDNLRESYRSGNQRVLLQAPTGSGKTIVAAEIIRLAEEKGSRVLFLCHRRELIFQSSDKLERFGVRHGIIMAGVTPDRWHNVQVASIQTLWVRGMKLGRMAMPECDLLVIDECHQSLAKTWRKLIDYFDCPTLGLTATPCRGDGAGLGHIYEEMVHTASIEDLTDGGFLVQARYFAPCMPDLEGVKIQMGDYVESQLAGRMDKVELVGDIIENWGRICPERQTIVFATGVKHSIHIRDRFEDAGVKVAHLDGSTPKDERDEVIRQFNEKEIQVITNCMILTHGWDCPPCSCCVLARPTKSLGLYLQMAGRALRPWPEKQNCLIIDHSGAVYEHGFLDEPIPWSLGEGKISDARAREYKRKKPITCENCKAVYSGQRVCPICGHEPVKKGRAFEVYDGLLGEISRDGREGAYYTMEDKARWRSMLDYFRIERGYKPGWTGWKYKEKFGAWPPRGLRYVRPIPPSPEVAGFIRAGQIRYTKSQ